MHISQILYIGEGCGKLATTSLLVLCKKNLKNIQWIKDKCTISLSCWEYRVAQVHVISEVCIWSVEEMAVHVIRLWYFIWVIGQVSGQNDWILAKFFYCMSME